MHPVKIISAAAAMALFVGTAQSAILPAPTHKEPVKGWTAVAGLSGPAVIEIARDMPIATEADREQPWCDHAGVVDSALKTEFEEELVTKRADGTELWGSDVMGTWTVVLARPDNVQCIIASGIGYEDGTDPTTFYAKVGLS